MEINAESAAEVLEQLLPRIRKEENLLPFDTRGDEGKFVPIKEITLPASGGILVDWEGKKYPTKGFPYYPTMEKIDYLKKVFMGLAYGFTGFRGKWILAIFFLLFRKRILKSAEHLISHLHGTIKLHLLRPERYCQAVREVYAAFEDEDRDIRDIVCMILEFDNAYRFRFQNVIGGLDKAAFHKNPYKELSRLLLVMEQCEGEPRLKTTWQMTRRLLFLMFFFKDVRNKVIKIVAKLNPETLELDEADRYHASTNHLFNLRTSDF